MRTFLYRCPFKSLNVQGWIEDREADGKEFVPQDCLACGRVHLVSPATGELMSEKFRPRDDR